MAYAVVTRIDVTSDFAIEDWMEPPERWCWTTLVSSAELKFGISKGPATASSWTILSDQKASWRSGSEDLRLSIESHPWSASISWRVSGALERAQYAASEVPSCVTYSCFRFLLAS